MKPTIDFAIQKFLAFNTLIFDDKLQLPLFQLSRARTFVAQFSCKKQISLLHKEEHYDYRLKFSICFDLPEEEWEDTIIHEMIHYYICVNGLKDSSSHGPIFRQMMQSINQRFGRNVTLTHRSTPEQKEQIYNTKRVWHVVAVVSFADGRKGLKVLPRIRQRIEAYRSTLLRDKRISRIDLYMSNDPYFNRFPNSSAFNVVLADEQEFMPHIEQAQPIEL